eukprot:GAHX01003689.1.p1 GENE.GAHX01003689.1~~GAHX01003689.1.p1  ORF type:complete len:92 (-),score=13.10 GAHX01003689.1:961-1236(-)
MGRARMTLKQEILEEKIKRFIKTVPTIESYNSRNKIENKDRLFLPATLFIKQLYNTYIKEQGQGFSCNYWVLYSIFHNFFNISFRSPRTDM